MFIIILIVVVFFIIFLMCNCSEGLHDMWVDDDIAMRSPNPYFTLYWGRKKDGRLMSPDDYFLQNQLYEEQGLIPLRLGWKKFTPSYYYPPGYALMGHI